MKTLNSGLVHLTFTWIRKDMKRFSPVRKKLQDHHIKVVSVTTPSCAYQYQYASQEKEILEESFRYFCNGLRVGAELGADRAVVNSGWGYWNESEDDRFRRSQENLYRIAEYAQTLGITCMMESMRNDETNIVYDIHSAKRMFDAVNHPNLKVMVDNIATGNAGETLEDWFEMFGNGSGTYAFPRRRSISSQCVGRWQYILGAATGKQSTDIILTDIWFRK